MTELMMLEGGHASAPPSPASAPDVPATPPPEPVAAPPEPVALEEADLNEVDPKDETKVRAILAELSRKRAENRELKTKADRTQELETYVAQNQPYIEVLRQNPGLLRQAPAAPAPAPVESRTEEAADAVEAAKLFDFYKPDGTPDAARGARHLALVRTTAQQIARQEVAPVQQQTARDKSAINFQRALQSKAPNGAIPNPQVLQALWQNSPPEDTANDQYASLLTLMALGADVAQGRAAVTLPTVAAPGRPPLVTEAAGDPQGRPRVSLSDLERDIALSRGVSEQKWQDQTKDYKAGRPNTLE